jgi:predicted RNA-binding protein with TRAM domain
VRYLLAHGAKETIRVTIGETGDAGDGAVDREERLDRRVVILVDVAAAQRVALRETDAMEAVLQLRVLANLPRGGSAAVRSVQDGCRVVG